MTRQLRLAQKIYANKSKLAYSDLLSKDDYECKRADLLRLATQHRRQRRLRISSDLCLVFETRFTAWLQIQEELRWLTQPSVNDLEEVVTRCNLLVTNPGELSATLFVDGGDNPASRYWIKCIAANAFNLALRLCGRVMHGHPRESPANELAAVHTFIFQPTASCGPATEIIWGDTAAQHTAPLSAVTRYVLTQDLNPASNTNCFLAPMAERAELVKPVHPGIKVGPPNLGAPKYPPLRAVVERKPETGGDTTPQKGGQNQLNPRAD